MKKLLFIIQSYPSERSANVRCDEKVMKELLSTGTYEIHCLTYQYEWQPLKEEINGFHIHRFRKSPMWDIYTWARHHTEKRLAKIIMKLNRVSLRIKQFVTIPIYPCYEPINSRLYARAAVKLNKREHFDMVLAEHHGYDTLYAGHILKSKLGENIKFIALLWDPFTGKSNPKYLPKAYAEKRIIKSEKKVLSNADAIVAMKSSESYHKEHSVNKSYYHKYHFLDIPGIVPPNPVHEKSGFIKEGMINILYSGLLNLTYRDPTFIVETISKSKFSEQINLIFLCSGDDAVRKLHDLRITFKGNMIIHGYVEGDVFSAVMQHADIFLNIGGENPYMVPSKIFGYMSYGKPIISTYSIEDDASKLYLEKYPLSLNVNINDDDPEAQSKRVDDFLGKNRFGKVPFDEVKALFPQNTPAAYAELIDSLLE